MVKKIKVKINSKKNKMLYMYIMNINQRGIIQLLDELIFIYNILKSV